MFQRSRGPEVPDGALIRRKWILQNYYDGSITPPPPRQHALFCIVLLRTPYSIHLENTRAVSLVQKMQLMQKGGPNVPEITNGSTE